MRPPKSWHVLAPVLMIACALGTPAGGAQPAAPRSRTLVLPRHVVLTKEIGQGPGCLLRVRLERPEAASALAELARVLRVQHCGAALPVIVWWLQPTTPPGGPPWGTAVFNPELVLRVPTAAPPGAQAAPASPAAPRPVADEAGRWRTGGVVARTIVIRREGRDWVVEHRFATGGVTVRSLRRRSSKRYEEVDSDAGNFYLIDARGDLELHDAEGLIGRAVKVN